MWICSLSRRISDERLAVMHMQVAGELRARKSQQGPVWLTIDVRDYACALDELRQRRRRASDDGPIKLAPLTRKLIAMKVGDVITVPAVTNSALSTNRATARKVLGAPDARWHAFTTAGTTTIERKPDGSAHEFGLPRSDVPDKLVKMRPGDWIVLQKPLYNALKIKARQMLRNQNAQWRSVKLIKGSYRVTRTR